MDKGKDSDDVEFRVVDIPFDALDAQDELAQQQVVDLRPKLASTRRLVVCVISTNPRTASVFASNLFARIGGGNFDYHVVAHSSKCAGSLHNALVPTIRMQYQKNLRMDEVKRLVSRNSLVMVMGDEYCRCAQDFCGNPDLVFARQYYSTAYEKSLYVPLGPRQEFPLLREEENFPFASERKYKYNLIVSPTSKVRKDLYAALTARQHNDGDAFLFMTPAFQANASEETGYVSPDEYRNVLLQSKFTLCPAGHNPEAFRIFEAIEAGSIPVLVNGDAEYTEHSCADAFANLLDSGAPFVVIKTWDELDAAVQPLLADPKALDDMQAAVQEWYSEYWKELTKRFECKFVRNSPLLDFSRSGYFYPKDCGDESVAAALPLLPQPPSSSKPKPTPLVTGCGRTGTLSLSDYIQQELGVKSIHEKMEPNTVSVSWLYAVPDAKAYPFEGRKVPRYREQQRALLQAANLPLFSPVVHIVRHPLKVISSTRRCFCGRGTRKSGLGRVSDALSWRFVESHIQMPKPNLPLDSLLRSMTYWYEWNMLIKRRHLVSQTLRIEDLDPNQLASGLGISVPPNKLLPSRIPKSSQHVSPEDEKIERPDSTWRDLVQEDADLARKIFDLALQFGYETDFAAIEEVI